MADPAAEPLIGPSPHLSAYYDSLESRIGYRLMLGGARHFGYYTEPSWSPIPNPFPIGRSLWAMEQKLFEALKLPTGSRVLDAGCGAGYVAVNMAKRGLQILAIDYTPHHVVKTQRNIARNHMEHQITVQRGDYHHLGWIPSESLDGVYTMETLVHATDPEAALANFYRIIKPGGRIAIHEYENVLQDAGTDRRHKSDWALINQVSHMPTNARARPHFWKDLLEDAGFVDVEVRDYSQNIKPMVFLFFCLGIIPYFFVRLFGLEKYFINTVSGVRSWTGRKYLRYVSVSATKPGGPIETDKSK
jgi:ubiquinone/menaquinone biosynthesis C-methylase UbiE